MSKTRELISIVTPMFNESENVPEYRRQIDLVTGRLADRYDFEFVITDNCSSDSTFEMLREWSREDARVRAFSFSRNYGYQRSIFTGYSLARGDAAIEIDADLQDPPDLLEKFLELRREGYKIVYGIRRKRPEGRMINNGRKLYYRLLKIISEYDLPLDAGDFMLIDRDILDQLKLVYDPSMYIRGVIFSFGFKRIGVPYERLARHMGKTKFNTRKMLGLAMDGIIGQSILPLRLASLTGLFIAVFTFLLSLVYVGMKLTVGINAPLGFTTIVVLILMSASINAVFLGIIGEYLARVYKHLQNRPLTIIEERAEREL